MTSEKDRSDNGRCTCPWNWSRVDHSPYCAMRVTSDDPKARMLGVAVQTIENFKPLVKAALAVHHDSRDYDETDAWVRWSVLCELSKALEAIGEYPNPNGGGTISAAMRRTSEATYEALGGKSVRQRVAEVRKQQEGCSTPEEAAAALAAFVVTQVSAEARCTCSTDAINMCPVCRAAKLASVEAPIREVVIDADTLYTLLVESTAAHDSKLIWEHRNMLREALQRIVPWRDQPSTRAVWPGVYPCPRREREQTSGRLGAETSGLPTPGTSNTPPARGPEEAGTHPYGLAFDLIEASMGASTKAETVAMLSEALSLLEHGTRRTKEGSHDPDQEVLRKTGVESPNQELQREERHGAREGAAGAARTGPRSGAAGDRSDDWRADAAAHGEGDAGPPGHQGSRVERDEAASGVEAAFRAGYEAGHEDGGYHDREKDPVAALDAWRSSSPGNDE